MAHKYWKKSKKSSGEPPVEKAPRNCRFLSLVVVELVLNMYSVVNWRSNLEKVHILPMHLKGFGAFSRHSQSEPWFML